MKLLDENKTLKYLKYSVGEIVLIILGILFAFQINDWNENRRAQAELDRYIVQLQKDVGLAISIIDKKNSTSGTQIAKNPNCSSLRERICNRSV